jgi:hypothetical protein
MKNRKSMKGVVDPITLGFILSIIGSATVLSLEGPYAADEVAKQDAIEKAELVAQQPTSESE